MAKFYWEDEIVYYLIEKVHRAPYMWDPNNNFYKNRLKKQQFWFRIVVEINKKFNPVIPLKYGELVRKWNNLKSYYTNENQKVLKAEQSGASAQELENIQSSWKFKSNLDFLSDSEIPLPDANNFHKTNSEVSYSEEISSGSSTPAVKQNSIGGGEFIKNERCSISPTPTNSSHTMPRLAAPKSAIPLVKTHLQTSCTENSVFGACIATEINNLAPDLQIAAKRQIFSILMDLQAEQLMRN